MNICCQVAYDGTRYAGWQKQPNVATVQGTIENCLTRLFKKYTPIQGAGRTDAGVHARCQYFTFALPSFFPREKLITALNSLLPPDIVVYSEKEVSPLFDVRRDARLRWYRYCFYYAPLPDPFERRYTFWIKPPFNWDAVENAISYFRGENDFSAFRSSRCSAHRGLIKVEHARLWREGNHIFFDIKARSFLHHMVRISAGTLWEVGRGAFSPASIPEILASRDRDKAGKTLEPQGLFLMDIRYNKGNLEGTVE